jgi:DNA polymerase
VSEREDREELAGIVAGLRRALARQPDRELLARGARLAPVATTSEASERSAVAAPMSEQRPSAVATPAPASSTTSAGPSPRAAIRAAEPAETDLFGNPAPTARPAWMTAPPPPVPVAVVEHPIDIQERAAIHAASLPILAQAAQEICACTKCGLSGSRTRAVPGTGTASSGIVFVGEAPGAEEDRQGLPFVGRAGELLTKIIKAMDDAHLIPDVALSRESVYICNVLKCRPPENRNPLPHEVEACSPHLVRQLEALKPRIICCLGKFAAELLLGVKGSIAGLRGRTYRYKGSKLIVTYHPAACLRNPNLKRPVWEDMQLLAREYQAG